MKRLASVLCLLLLFPAAADAGPILDRAVRCLRVRPVCVEDGGGLAAHEARALREAIVRNGAGPMFVAVLPASALAEAGGVPSRILAILHRRLGRRGTYAVVAGPSFRAVATRGFPHAPPLAEAAYSSRSGRGVYAVLADFVRRVADARAGVGAGTGYAPVERPSSDGDGGGSSVLPIAVAALLGLGGGGALLLNSRRQRRRREEREPAEVKGDEGDVHIDRVHYGDEGGDS